MNILRRKNGNFIYELTMKADLQNQYKLQSELQKADLWETFLRYTIQIDKNSSFDAEVIGIVAQCLITDEKLLKQHKIHDLQKLKMFYIQTADVPTKLVYK
jgi:hypothetical protein